MMYGWHDGGWGIAWMVLSCAVIVALVLVVVRAFSPNRNWHDPSRDPKDVLAERFARGEIDAEEYRERLSVLDGSRTPTKKR